MEEVQSWWEVPTVAHFCYAFRSAFNLVYFEIAELESALLNIQDPDMSVSLDQLVMRILQGCYDDDEPVTEDNWEDKLKEFLEENCEDDENPFKKSLYFVQLTPRSKMEILFKLCELRLDVEGALDAIKDIPSKDMQARCLGKDAQNNFYWYFCDERLYKEAASSSSGKKLKIQKSKDVKQTSKSTRTVNTREKRAKISPNIDTSWMIVCHNVSDWEKLKKTYSKTKNPHEKELVSEIDKLLPLVQERVVEKDRLLRKRFLELAPKRASSRILQVQEKRKIEELRAEKEAERKKIQAEKERVKKEAEKIKYEKQGRQRRAEERQKAIEERAERVKLREIVRVADSDDDDNDDDEEDDLPSKKQKRCGSRIKRSVKNESDDEREDSEADENDNESDHKTPKYQYKTNKRTKNVQSGLKQTIRIYSRGRVSDLSTNKQMRVSVNISKTSKYRYIANKSVTKKEDYVPELSSKRISPRLQQKQQHSKKIPNSCRSRDDKSDSDSNVSEEASDISDTDDRENRSKVNKSGKLISKENSLALPKTYSNGSPNILGRNVSSRMTANKTAVLQNSSHISEWNSTFDAKGQKLHILHDTYDLSSPRKSKLSQMKTSRLSPSNIKTLLAKENHVRKPFHQNVISYGKIIPSPVRINAMKSSVNHKVSS